MQRWTLTIFDCWDRVGYGGDGDRKELSRQIEVRPL